MLFEFMHNERKCAAFVNEKLSMTLNHTLIIYLLDCNSELGYYLIFTRREKMKWDTISSIKNNYPVTYNCVCDKLEEIFGYKFSKELTPSLSVNAAA